jgi:hypothetical protein
MAKHKEATVYLEGTNLRNHVRKNVAICAINERSGNGSSVSQKVLNTHTAIPFITFSADNSELLSLSAS